MVVVINPVGSSSRSNPATYVGVFDPIRRAFADANQDARLQLQLADRPQLRRAAALPGSSMIHASAWYDNSAANRSNPDATAEVRWGEQTDEEMMFTALSYLIDDEAAAETTQQQ